MMFDVEIVSSTHIERLLLWGIGKRKGFEFVNPLIQIVDHFAQAIS